MVPYQQQVDGYQLGTSAPQPTDNHLMQHMGYQPQAMAHQHVAYQPQPPLQQPHLAAQQQGNVFQNINWASRIANVMKSQFGLKPKEPTYMYRKAYLDSYDKVVVPHRYRVPDFTKFSGQDNVTTIEHINHLVERAVASASFLYHLGGGGGKF
jgi:hypothetical protein